MSSRPNPTTLNLGLEVRDRGSLRTEQERDSLGGEAGCWTGRGGTGRGPPSEERPPLAGGQKGVGAPALQPRGEGQSSTHDPSDPGSGLHPGRHLSEEAPAAPGFPRLRPRGDGAVTRRLDFPSTEPELRNGSVLSRSARCFEIPIAGRMCI